MINVNFVIINPILCRNAVLKVARVVSADATEQPNDEEVYDEDGNPELSITLGKVEFPNKKRIDDKI